MGAPKKRLARSTDNRFWLLLLGLFLLAFCIRLGVGLTQRSGYWEQGDITYFRIAENLAQRGEYALTPGTPTIWRPPVYPVLLAFAYSIFGKSTFAFVAFNAFINTLVVVATYLLALHIFGRHVGFVATLFVAFYPYLIWQSGHIIENGTLSLLLLILVLMILKAAKTSRLRWYILAGIAGGLAVLAKSVTLPFLLLSLAWPQFRRPGKAGFWLSGFFPFVLTVGFTLLPWAARNAVVFGTPQITESNGELNLWKGNNPVTFVIYPQYSLDSIGPYEQSIMPSRINGDSDRNRWYLSEVVEYATQQPAKFSFGIIRKAALLYDWNVVPRASTNATIDAVSGTIIMPGQDRSLFEKVLYTVPYLCVLLLAAIGVKTSMRSSKGAMALVGLLFLSWTAVHALVFAYTRYRMQIEPFLLIWAACGLVQLVDSYLVFRQRRPFEMAHTRRSESVAGE